MRISSSIIYCWPCVAVCLVAAYLFGGIIALFEYKTVPPYNEFLYWAIFVILSIIAAGLLYFVLRIITLKWHTKYLKFIIAVLPCIFFIVSLSWKHSIYFSDLVASIIRGVLLYYLCTLLSNRIVCTLTDTAIDYQNLFGYKGTIPLTSITKLEQMRKLLIFKEIRTLVPVMKTRVSFIDENIDEYDIDIFIRRSRNNKIFDKIIENANNCGNLKIRQYVY